MAVISTWLHYPCRSFYGVCAFYAFSELYSHELWNNKCRQNNCKTMFLISILMNHKECDYNTKKFPVYNVLFIEVTLYAFKTVF